MSLSLCEPTRNIFQFDGKTSYFTTCHVVRMKWYEGNKLVGSGEESDRETDDK
jgi:hypothetical protein